MTGLAVYMGHCGVWLWLEECEQTRERVEVRAACRSVSQATAGQITRVWIRGCGARWCRNPNTCRGHTLLKHQCRRYCLHKHETVTQAVDFQQLWIVFYIVKTSPMHANSTFPHFLLILTDLTRLKARKIRQYNLGRTSKIPVYENSTFLSLHLARRSIQTDNSFS